MIRAAVAADLPALVEMGAAFHAETPWPAQVAPYHPESFAKLCVDLNEYGVLLVAERDGEAVAMCGASYTPVYFNHACRVAQEVFLYAKPAHRNGPGAKLLIRLADETRKAGARALFASSVEGSPGDASEIYRRLGFVPTERAFTKVL